jgi:hypothetical protein
MQPTIATRQAAAPTPFVSQRVFKLQTDGSAIKCLFSDESSLTLSRFLAGFHNGTVELGQEVASENEAMVESFRVGGSFAVVTEWRAQVDLATGAPVIKKEAVKSEKKVAHS